MLPEPGSRPLVIRLVRVATVGLACVGLSSCYLAHVSAGHMALMNARRPIAEVMAAPDADPALRERLEYVLAARRFASAGLGLPDNGSFTTYVELDRPNVAWNVFAAGEFSVEPKTWCFVVAGCVSYRGYFDQARANDYAGRLRSEGYDVYVAPVAAYSTLGHFEDPVLSTMMDMEDAELAGLIFHELAHQVAYVPGDTAFNEAFATTVELEGVKRWLDSRGRGADLAAYRQARERLFRVIALIDASRERLGELYASGLAPPAMRSAKATEFDRLREDYRRLRAGWADGRHYDGLLSADLNNARLAATAAYHQCVPGFVTLLQRQGGDLPDFYGAVRELAEAGPEAREAAVCRSSSAVGAGAEPGVAGAFAFEPEVAGNDAPQGLRLDAQAAEAAGGADAGHGE